MNIVIEGGRIIDPAQKIDTVANLYIHQGTILAIGHEHPKAISPMTRWMHATKLSARV
ncbi:hypothetical protein [Nitrincola nitratireducens]|uniref:D-glutamate deacylase n=1 Tax=Nitrincola nitratireducens TaxID=1229521 RepID=W9UZA6_9GAMM|nr:D-glutamate deacylase [Nitrincola nitratireducens]